MFAFICNECGYGMALWSGVPFMCSVCEKILCFRRVTHEEYHDCETNDGKIKEVIR